MLTNGLKYITPCQSRFSHRRSKKKMIANEYETISKIIKKCLDSNQTSITDERAKQAFSELEQIINDLYRKPLPRKLYRRAQREYKKVQYLQKFLRSRSDIIICQIDKSPGFYIGDASTIELKAYEYMTTTKAYKEIEDGRHSPLADNLRSVQTLLQNLLQQRAITKELYDKLYPKMNNLELAHFHGLPKVHKTDIPLRPIIAGINAPVTLISKFLNHLLAPIYLQVARETTFIHSIDVVRKLETYVTHGYFKSTTKFITIDVKNLYTMIPRNGAIEALIRFLNKYSKDNKIGTLTIDTILRMTRLILDTNCFAYKDKYYKQIHGGAMGSAFTQVLANIYMLEWEQDLIKYQTSKKEIYGRYIDDIFMTTNDHLAIDIQLEKANKKDVNIQIDSVISTTVNYLDVLITNENDQLKTCVYHKPTSEPYYLPYRSDHPHKFHRNIPYSALIRAARLCSNVDDFNLERLRIEIALLLGQYPPKFISEQFLRFFQVNNAMPVLKELNQTVYQRLHQQLIHQITENEKKLNDSIKDPVRYPSILQKKPWDRTVMYPRYKFEKGPMATFPNQFYSWWKKHYQYPGSPVKYIKVRLIPKTNRTLARQLIYKKPPRRILHLTENTNTS